MSISQQYAEQHLNDPAVICCRTVSGTLVTVSILEDPAIFPDLVDASLLDLTNCLTIGQVLDYSHLNQTYESLTPLTASTVDQYKSSSSQSEPSNVPTIGTTLKYLTINNVKHPLGRQTKVFYGTPDSTFTDVQQDDYLVNPNNGCTYQYNGTSWVVVTDYNSAIEEVQAILTSTDDGAGNVILGYRGVLNADIIEY